MLGSSRHLAVLVQAADLQKACAISRQDPGSDLAPTEADFQARVQSLAAQLMQVPPSTTALTTSRSCCCLSHSQCVYRFNPKGRH